MEPFSALLALCAGNSPVTGEFPAQRPVTQSFDDFFDMRLNKRLSKQAWGWWLETPSRPLWCHCNEATKNQLLWYMYKIVNDIFSSNTHKQFYKSQIMSSYKLGKINPRSLSISNIFDWAAPLNANTTASSYKINTALAQILQPKTSDVLQKMLLQLQCGPVKTVKYLYNTHNGHYISPYTFLRRQGMGVNLKFRTKHMIFFCCVATTMFAISCKSRLNKTQPSNCPCANQEI